MLVMMVVFCLSGHCDEAPAANTTDDQFAQLDEHLKKGDFVTAYALGEQLLQAGETQHDRSLQSRAYSKLGVVRMYEGMYVEALGFFQKSLANLEIERDTVAVAKTYNYIASVHHLQKNYSAAIDYYKRSLKLQLGTDDRQALGILYNNLGSLYEDLSDCSQATIYHHQSRLIWEELKDTSWMGVSLHHIAYCMQMGGNTDEALETYLRSYQMVQKSNNTWNLVNIGVRIGNLYVQIGDVKKGIKWCNEAYQLAKKKNYSLGIQESCECLFEAHDRAAEVDEAYRYYREFVSTRDSLSGNDRVKQLTQLEMNFNFEREQLADSLEFAKEVAIQNERIQRQRFGLISIGSVVVLVLGLAFSIYHGKRRSDHLLLNILPAKIAEELKETGTAKAKRLENVTVLFTDFKGFTAISEKLTPIELVAEIHECFVGFDRIIDRYGIEKIKTIGDAYMAAGGVPEPKTTHALDVVAAALDIQTFMQERAEMKRQQGEPFFEVRIGVHTGPVVAGIVGIRKFQYDIWGDTVNTASRLESSGEPGKVNVSHTAYELIKDHYACTYRGKIAAKGKGHIDMYFVEVG